MIVGGGSLLDCESSIRVVPSAVQKLSQPSVNVWLHFGQRFISKTVLRTLILELRSLALFEIL